MQDLIGDIELDERLRQQGEDDRKERERRGWDAVHWRYGTGSTDDERGIRWRVDEAMALLDEMATAADVGICGDARRPEAEARQIQPEALWSGLPTMHG